LGVIVTVFGVESSNLAQLTVPVIVTFTAACAVPIAATDAASVSEDATATELSAFLLMLPKFRISDSRY
jgi:hypothetical protein